MIKILSSTGNLGDTPFEEESFFRGLRRKPDYLAADAGSSDLGPTYLGADISHNPKEWEKHDLELLLVASREAKTPLFIGSCGSTGTNRGVDSYLDTIREIAVERKLEPFKVVTIYAELDHETVHSYLRKDKITKLGAPYELTDQIIDDSSHITAMMGIEPFIQAIKDGADVVLAGRSCDDAIYAAYPIHLGYPKGLSLHMGKAIECASLVGFPQMVKESVLATLTEESVILEAMHPDQVITAESTAAHSMYERTNPYVQALPGGYLDMHHTIYKSISNGRTEITGSVFVKEDKYRVKLEGAGEKGYRAFFIAGIRDPYAIRYIDMITSNSRRIVAEKFPTLKEEIDYRLHYHVYGKNGVMGVLEPKPEQLSKELCIVVDVIGRTQEIATSVAKMAKHRIFYTSYPHQKNLSAGGAAFIIDQALVPESKAYGWTIDHLVELDDPLESFTFRSQMVGGI